ncbi:hypothetical protein INN71_09600 [Nocardioides sp. ChNu-153]|uniref:hypothetical protein n=1 Tax=unclassified Nocardioides TaxID=2615069 RepID=UPI0024074DC1|nr:MULTISPECIES: hypothetical protein [unclassified Nocardioides]MDF9715660.1 hypothetical protein [Nocardioides sp. ChNu-99]MDN7121644.1 hypothetical protein [Nocardioides sp. ChNu-153]
MTATADRLLDAHTRWVVDRLTTGGPDGSRDEAIAEDVDLLLDLGSELTLSDVLSPDEVSDALERVLVTVPPSEGAARFAASVADALLDGDIDRFALSDVVSRAHVEAWVRRVLAGVDGIEAALDRLTRSPQVATLAGGFVGRIVGEVVQANRAAAEKIPGVGSLVSFGANAAGRVGGAANRQLEGLLGDTAGKGAVFAMRRLNKVLVDTLRDPTMPDAFMEVFDLYRDEPLPRVGDVVSRDEAHEIAGLVHEVVAGAAPSPPVQQIATAVVRQVWADHGDRPVTALLEELGLTRDELVVHAISLAPRLLDAAHADGRLEALVRGRLAPFYASDEVAGILEA